MEPSTMYHIQSPWITRPRPFYLVLYLITKTSRGLSFHIHAFRTAKVQQLDYWLIVSAVSCFMNSFMLFFFTLKNLRMDWVHFFFMDHRIYAIYDVLFCLSRLSGIARIWFPIRTFNLLSFAILPILRFHILWVIMHSMFWWLWMDGWGR